ncbi:MAG: hypothetical protein HUJ74_04475 [Lachnospiraceae bacterium]|nr:hypothetical protein [Lachnospiraceae bacterium]
MARTEILVDMAFAKILKSVRFDMNKLQCQMKKYGVSWLSLIRASSLEKLPIFHIRLYRYKAGV